MRSLRNAHSIKAPTLEASASAVVSSRCGLDHQKALAPVNRSWYASDMDSFFRLLGMPNMTPNATPLDALCFAIGLVAGWAMMPLNV